MGHPHHPVNTRRRHSVALVLGQRRRRWHSTETALFRRLVLAAEPCYYRWNLNYVTLLLNYLIVVIAINSKQCAGGPAYIYRTWILCWFYVAPTLYTVAQHGSDTDFGSSVLWTGIKTISAEISHLPGEHEPLRGCRFWVGQMSWMLGQHLNGACWASFARWEIPSIV